MKGQYTANKFSDGSNRKNDAKKSLNNYINQLEKHFELSNSDVISVLESMVKTKKNIDSEKKWWHIF